MTLASLRIYQKRACLTTDCLQTESLSCRRLCQLYNIVKYCEVFCRPMPITGFFICRGCRRLENSGADVCWMKGLALRLKINCDPQCVLWAHWVLDSPVKIHCSLHTPQLQIESGHSAQSSSLIISRYCFFQITMLGYLVPTAFIRLNSSVHKSCHSAKSSTSFA